MLPTARRASAQNVHWMPLNRLKALSLRFFGAANGGDWPDMLGQHGFF
jgi:hypothetical protein